MPYFVDQNEINYYGPTRLGGGLTIQPLTDGTNLLDARSLTGDSSALRLDDIQGTLDASKLYGDASGLASVTATGEVRAGTLGAYNDPVFDVTPVVSMAGVAPRVDFAPSGGGGVDTRVGRTAAGVFGGIGGTVIEADRLGGSLPTDYALLGVAQTWGAVQSFNAAPAFNAAGDPFTVSSAALVENLNADLLEGEHGAYYLSRANHTGTQAAGTITGLAAVATSGAASDVSGLAAVATSGSATDIAAGTLDLDRLEKGSTGTVLLGVTASSPLYGQVTDAHVDPAAAIAFSKLAGVAAASHTHTFADLSGVAAASHVHSAADVTTGTLDDLRLSANVALENAANTFTQDQLISRTGSNSTWTATRASGASVIMQAQSSVGIVGTNTAHPLRLFVGGGTKWEIPTTGHLLAFADNTYDIGATGANRPRDAYLARNLVVGNDLTVGNNLIMPSVDTSIAATGGALAVPSNAVGFVHMTLNGAVVCLPYFTPA